MKIIDRYLIREFFLPFLYSTLAFFLLYLVADLFEHMDEFLRAGTPWLDIIRYYLFMLPFIYTQTAPFALVLSLIYELGNLARHSEIIGMKASGISSKRIALPFIILGIGLSTFFLLLSEFVLPNTSFQLEGIKSFYFEKNSDQKNSFHKDITYSNVKENYVFFIQELDLKNKLGKNLQIHYLNSHGSVTQLVRAEEGRWLDEEWWFFDGQVIRYDENGELSTPPEKFVKRMMNIYESPKDLIREEKASEQMNYFQYRTSLIKRYGHQIPKSQRVSLYSKISWPLISLVLVLMVIPIGLKITRGGALAVLGKTLLLTLVYYGSQFLIMGLGKQGYLHPLIACWLPNLFFGSLGTIFLLRSR